jgi:hypothetical protein
VVSWLRAGWREAGDAGQSFLGLASRPHVLTFPLHDYL